MILLHIRNRNSTKNDLLWKNHLAARTYFDGWIWKNHFVRNIWPWPDQLRDSLYRSCYGLARIWPYFWPYFWPDSWKLMWGTGIKFSFSCSGSGRVITIIIKLLMICLMVSVTFPNFWPILASEKQVSASDGHARELSEKLIECRVIMKPEIANKMLFPCSAVKINSFNRQNKSDGFRKDF